MYLKKSFNKKRNKTQLSFVQGYRIDGKVKHKVIKNLGYLEDYLDQYEDPIAHFQQIAKEWNADQETLDTIEVSLSEKLPDQCFNHRVPDTFDRRHPIADIAAGYRKSALAFIDIR